jgi:hypothetical protein
VVGVTLQDEGREWPKAQLESDERDRLMAEGTVVLCGSRQSVMAEPLRTPSVTVRESGGSYRPGPNISTRRAIIYRTSPNQKAEEPSPDTRKSKTVSFHSATSLPTERKISSGKLHLYSSCDSIRISSLFLLCRASMDGT